MFSQLSRLVADSATSSSANGPGLLVIVLIAVIVGVFLIVAMWKVFVKAGRPGWAAIIPVYNTWVLFEIAGKPGWWVLPLLVVGFIPFVGAIVDLVVYIIVGIEVAKRFGRGTWFGVFGLAIFSFIGYPILAFGDAQYQDPDVSAAAGGTPANGGLWSQAGGAAPVAPAAPTPTPPQPEVAAPAPPTPPAEPVTNPLPPQPPQAPQDPQNPTPPANPVQ